MAVRDGRLGVKGWVWAGRYSLNRWAYLFHRITGLALVLYLVAHVMVTGTRALGREAWEGLMATLENPITHFFEWLLVVAFIYHAVNGFRLLLFEYFGVGIGKPGRIVYPYRNSVDRQRPLMYFLMVLGALFIGASIFAFVSPGR